MKIYEFKGEELEYWTPKKIEDDNGKVHHNLRVGDYAEECWEYVMGIEDSIVDLTDAPMPLNDEYFFLHIPSKGKDKYLKDKRGNFLYYIKEVVGKVDEPKAMLGFTLTSRSVLSINVTEEVGIERLGSFKKNLEECVTLHVYVFKPNSYIDFTLKTKLGTIDYRITMVKNKLVLTLRP